MDDLPALEHAFYIARQQLEARVASGDLAGAYDKWLRLMHVEGVEYSGAVKSGDMRSAAMAALGALVVTADMIPVEPQNLPALMLLDALRDMIIDASNGAKSHPILLNRAHLQGHGKGVTMERKRFQTLAVFCAKVLLQWGDEYSQFLVEAFRCHDKKVKGSTLRIWMHRSGNEPFGGALADGILTSADMREHLAGVASRADAEAFCRTIIDYYLSKRRVATTN